MDFRTLKQKAHRLSQYAESVCLQKNRILHRKNQPNFNFCLNLIASSAIASAIKSTARTAVCTR